MDKVVYSIVWLVLQLWFTAWVFPKEGAGWDITYGIMFVANLVQLALVCHNLSDWHSRRRMWHALRGSAQYITKQGPCPHGWDDWDDCPDCRH